MFNQSTKADSVSGVATATGVRQSGDRFQVSLLNASGSGTVTITVRPGSKSDAYESITDGTISVGTPTTLYVTGRVNAVKATSSNSGDSFTLEVLG